MKLTPYTLHGRTYNVRIEKSHYNNGMASLRLVEDGGEEDGFPFATCTVALPGELENGEVAIKNYSENEGMLQFLIKNEVINYPHRHVQSGYVNIPVCTLK